MTTEPQDLLKTEASACPDVLLGGRKQENAQLWGRESLSRGGASIGFGGESRVTNSGVKGRTTGKLGDMMSRRSVAPRRVVKMAHQLLDRTMIVLYSIERNAGVSHCRDKKGIFSKFP